MKIDQSWISFVIFFKLSLSLDCAIFFLSSRACHWRPSAPRQPRTQPWPPGLTSTRALPVTCTPTCSGSTAAPAPRRWTRMKASTFLLNRVRWSRSLVHVESQDYSRRCNDNNIRLRVRWCRPSMHMSTCRLIHVPGTCTCSRPSLDLGIPTCTGILKTRLWMHCTLKHTRVRRVFPS